MSDESDLNCLKGHILNEEIDRAKVICSRKHGGLANKDGGMSAWHVSSY